MDKLAGRVAIVTGASKGIGAAIARNLSAAGAAVVVNYGSDKDGAQRVVAEITAAGGKAVSIMGSVAKEGDIENLFSEAKRIFGPVDILINNAGVFTPTSLEGVTVEEFHRHFNINVLGTILAIQAFARQTGETGGSVVNITSASVENPGAFSTVPVASKSAVVALTKVLAKELGPRKIRVNAVGPGAVDTDGLRKIGVTDDIIQQVITSTPLGRIGHPEDVAPIVTFLSSNDAFWLSGEHILASGGAR